MHKIGFLKSADFILNMLKKHERVAIQSGVKQSIIDLHKEAIGSIHKISSIVTDLEVSENYIIQFQRNMNTIQGCLPFGVLVIQSDTFVPDNNTKPTIENSELNLQRSVKEITFNIDFFTKTGFLNRNIVAVGANGSGKTSLSNKFKHYMQGNGIVISAQRILRVPSFDYIQNPSNTLATLKSYQTQEKTMKNEHEFNNIHSEFEVVLKNLISQNNADAFRYKEESLKQNSLGQPITPPNTSALERTIEIWNSLIEHRNMCCRDGMNIIIEIPTGNQYPAIQMSDGEKVILFLISQVLQAPINGFVIVDEPEMYLHKTILKKLWDFLEIERNDCIFIYLTHDLDFASNRTTAKKIWVKSFNHPDIWELEDIPENELPEPLMLELLGSRKNILFCEGEKGSLDEKIFNILFPNFTIVPVENCNSVISYTKAFNKLPNLTTIALGIVDSDHHDPVKLKSLEKDRVFSFKMAECENLLLDENFLILVSEKLIADEHAVENIKKEVLKSLEENLELQVSNYISSKVNYYFRSSHISRGNTLASLKENFERFTNGVEIDNWHNIRSLELKNFIQQKDYKSAVSVYNNKGLIGIANRHLKIKDFKERSITILQADQRAQNIILKHFPKELV
jgi:ABC-type cobalamin/Fe3+-siderophores transport system ATPase subunit